MKFVYPKGLDYLLHIPVSMMRKDNEFYMKVVAYVRKNFFKMLNNKILTKKNKIYLALFAIAPKGLRVVHAKLRGID